MDCSELLDESWKAPDRKPETTWHPHFAPTIMIHEVLVFVAMFQLICTSLCAPLLQRTLASSGTAFCSNQ